MNLTAILTRRENQIAELIAWGSSKKEIANHLYISTRTVENTARSIYEKAGVTKANELSAWWFCSHYNISLETSPLRKRIIAIIFLLVFLPYEYFSHFESTRYTRNTRARVEESRERESEEREEIDFLILTNLQLTT